MCVQIQIKKKIIIISVSVNVMTEKNFYGIRNKYRVKSIVTLSKQSIDHLLFILIYIIYLSMCIYVHLFIQASNKLKRDTAINNSYNCNGQYII